METDCIVGIQDMGAAGLTSSSSEMAGRGGSGIELDLSCVPLREPGMTPYEILLSESQERMLLVAKKGTEDEIKRIFDKWDLDAVVIGRVTDDRQFRALFDGVEVAFYSDRRSDQGGAGLSAAGCAPEAIRTNSSSSTSPTSRNRRIWVRR